MRKPKRKKNTNVDENKEAIYRPTEPITIGLTETVIIIEPYIFGTHKKKIQYQRTAKSVNVIFACENKTVFAWLAVWKPKMTMNVEFIYRLIPILNMSSQTYHVF